MVIQVAVGIARLRLPARMAGAAVELDIEAVLLVRDVAVLVALPTRPLELAGAFWETVCALDLREIGVLETEQVPDARSAITPVTSWARVVRVRRS